MADRVKAFSSEVDTGSRQENAPNPEVFGLRSVRLAAAFVLAAACAACAGVSDPVGLASVTQDKFDYSNCQEILANRTMYTNRTRELQDLVSKAESSPGGMLVGYTAYRSELVNSRAQLAAAERAARLKNCAAGKPRR